MKKILFFTALLLLCFANFSCDRIRPEQGCTEIFKMVNLHIQGKKLDSCYTIRLSNNDTIRNFYEGQDDYPVLNDRYQDALANSQDSFHFVGLIKDSIVVVEPFVFEADNCHIFVDSQSHFIN